MFFGLDFLERLAWWLPEMFCVDRQRRRSLNPKIVVVAYE